jgi:hypothetical protein
MRPPFNRTTAKASAIGKESTLSLTEKLEAMSGVRLCNWDGAYPRLKFVEHCVAILVAIILPHRKQWRFLLPQVFRSLPGGTLMGVGPHSSR